MFQKPMLLERIESPIDSSDYITELKFDGIRLLLSKFDNQIQLYTRHKTNVTQKFISYFKNINIPDGTILDGELIALNNEGKPDFELIMGRFHSDRIEANVQFCTFDILYLNYKKITSLSLIKRKELLDEVISSTPESVAKTSWIDGSDSTQFYDVVCNEDLEGIVQKKKTSIYELGKRSSNWLKVINYKYEEVYIYGYSNKTQSFLLSSKTTGKYIGSLKFIPINERKKMQHLFQPINYSSNNQGTILFKQGLELTVKFRNLTSKGKLHIPSFFKW